MGEDIFTCPQIDIDLIALEAAFFEKCSIERHAQNPSCSSDADAPDSGFSTSREPLIPLKHRNGHEASKLLITKMKLKAKILAAEKIRDRSRTKDICINLSNASFHILETIDLSPNEESVYLIENGVANLRSREQGTTVFGTNCSFACMQRMISRFVGIRLKMDMMCDFFDFHRSRNIDLPKAIEALCQYFDKFTLQYVVLINKLKRNPPSLGTLSTALKEIKDEVDYLHSIIYPLKGVISWTWAEVELFWSVFVNSFGSHNPLSASMVKLVIELQASIFPCFFDIMNSIYCDGRIPPSHKDYFVLYSDDDSPHHLTARLPKKNFSSLWEDGLAEKVIRGAFLSHHLYNNAIETNRFQEMFILIRQQMELDGELLDAFAFRRLFQATVWRLNSQLELEFNDKLKLGGITEVLYDVKSFAIGKACQRISSRLFHIQTHRAYKIDLLFNGVINECAIGRFCSWSLSPARGELFGKLKMQVNKPMSSIVTDRLVEATTNSLNFWIKLVRVEDLLSTMLREYSSYLYREGATGRKFRILMSRLFRIVQIIREQFANKTTNIFDICLRVVESSSSGSEIEASIEKLTGELMAMTDKNASQRIREALGLVDHYAELVDEIMLNLLSRNVTTDNVGEWSRKTTRSLQYLTTIGKYTPKNNLFNNAYLRLRYEESWEQRNPLCS